jgi:hypothetical protein
MPIWRHILKSKVFFAGFLAVLALLFFGCATSKDAADDFSDVVVTAMGVPQGIQINFESIPEDTNHLYITLHDATENYEIMSYVRIFDEELENLKGSGNLVCPFTEKGHVYRISIYYYSQDNILPDDCVNVAAIARGGNYPSELSFDIPQIYENMVWAIGIPGKVDSIALF